MSRSAVGILAVLMMCGFLVGFAGTNVAASAEEVERPAQATNAEEPEELSIVTTGQFCSEEASAPNPFLEDDYCESDCCWAKCIGEDCFVFCSSFLCWANSSVHNSVTFCPSPESMASN